MMAIRIWLLRIRSKSVTFRSDDGLVVLPAHPLRVAWHAAYNLVLHSRYEQERLRSMQEELSLLDGAMFPAFLPGLNLAGHSSSSTLGFHTVGMVADDDREPRQRSRFCESGWVTGVSRRHRPLGGKRSGAW